jgi:hypothetical protein
VGGGSGTGTAVFTTAPQLHVSVDAGGSGVAGAAAIAAPTVAVASAISSWPTASVAIRVPCPVCSIIGVVTGAVAAGHSATSPGRSPNPAVAVVVVAAAAVVISVAHPQVEGGLVAVAVFAARSAGRASAGSEAVGSAAAAAFAAAAAGASITGGRKRVGGGSIGDAGIVRWSPPLPLDEDGKNPGRTCACRTAKVATSHPAAQPSGASGGRSLDGRGGEMDLQPAHHAAKPRIIKYRLLAQL